MREVACRTDEEHALAETLCAFDEGTRLLEDAYRELWVAREEERAERTLAESERIRDLCHEVRNPLGGVRGLAELLRREVEALPKALRLLDAIVAGLDAADVALRRASVREEERCDAGILAEETVGLALAENQASGGDIRFRVEAPEGVELPLPASRFRELLASLVRNAAEACAPDGRVEVRIESTPAEVVVSVEDDGRGLPRIPDAALFRRGFSTKGPDRGRGLARAGEIVSSARGKLVFGRLARGTVARVRLPR
jgi:signal transduction histidine kinase